MAVTIQQIALKAGVSKATVSRVLNGLAVKLETEHRVRQVMEQMKYHPHRFARGLAGRASGLLGVLVPEVDHPYISSVVGGIERETRRHGYLLALGTTEKGNFSEALRSFIHPPLVDALLILVPTQEMEPELTALAREKFPFVVVSERRFESIAPCVVLDNQDGARQAVQYLVRTGHRRVAIITGPDSRSDASDRLEGYKEVLRESGIPLDESLIVPGNFSLQAGETGMDRLLLLPNPPTAVFASNDMMALGALQRLAARPSGPKVAVVGFDNLPLSALVKPALTTVDYDLAELGAQAAAKALRLASGDEKGLSTVHLKTQLLVRESA
jgi:DNA-binding LacI/PurR family transcriptional regulator